MHPDRVATAFGRWRNFMWSDIVRAKDRQLDTVRAALKTTQEANEVLSKSDM